MDIVILIIFIALLMFAAYLDIKCDITPEGDTVFWYSLGRKRKYIKF